jgi:tetratricopeptide (TPR) repeat protein
MPQGVADLLRQCFQRNPDERPKDMQELGSRLRKAYQVATGGEYARPKPQTVDLAADSLNNRGLGLLDLGRAEEALATWDEALVKHPGHFEATYNRGVQLWGQARVTDQSVVEALCEARDGRASDWLAAYHLGLLHLARFDGESAKEILTEAVKLGGGGESQAALRRAEDLSRVGGRCVRTFEGHTGAVMSVCLSSDGRWALSGSTDKTLRLWEVSSGRCVRTFKGHTGAVPSVCLSSDGRWALSGSEDKTLRLWELEWVFEAHDLTDWDEGARPWLGSFLALHSPYAAELPAEGTPSEEQIQLALTRRGKPIWTDDDFKQLLHTLACAGYGWLRPEGVRKKLEEMTANWQGPPPLPGQQ